MTSEDGVLNLAKKEQSKGIHVRGLFSGPLIVPMNSHPDSQYSQCSQYSLTDLRQQKSKIN